MIELVRAEAEAAAAALDRLHDDAVGEALHAVAAGLVDRADRVLEANERDLAAAATRLDEGGLDRLRLTTERVEEIARQVRAVAVLPPLDRAIDAWTLDNGLRVEARRIPIGVVGANFEARPAVALDIASQLLKSGNACVLRTGSAALGTVTVLVDDVVRPALEGAGIPGAAVGLVRDPGHAGALALASLPDLIPLVILRGSGETTAGLQRHAAEHGVQALAHAEGGGVLYLDRSADADKALRLIGASLDRLGVCNRLNLLLVHRDASAQLGAVVELLDRLGLRAYGTRRACALADVPELTERLGHEWANDPEHVRSVSLDVVESLEEACAIGNGQTSALAAGIVAEDEAAAAEFFRRYRGTTGFWHAPTRFTDGFALMGVPETGINVGFGPGPRGPVTYRDLWLKQLRVVGDGTQAR